MHENGVHHCVCGFFVFRHHYHHTNAGFFFSSILLIDFMLQINLIVVGVIEKGLYPLELLFKGVGKHKEFCPIFHGQFEKRSGSLDVVR